MESTDPVAQETSRPSSAEPSNGVGPALRRAGWLHPITRRLTVVGRSDPYTGQNPDLDLASLDDDKAVSRRHAELIFRHGIVLVTDLGSRNGTWINGEVLSPSSERELADGDEVAFGNVRLTYSPSAPWPPGVTAEWAGDTHRAAGSSNRKARATDLAADSRILATVLFTDIVGSTPLAAALGDAAWSDLLERHRVQVRGELMHYGGREVDTPGDGFMAYFDIPGRAILCAQEIIAAAPDLGLQVRAGIHTGECELVGPRDIRGIAVHIAARVAGKAGASEILVSGTTRDLSIGSGVQFTDRGKRLLKGVPGRWHIYMVGGPHIDLPELPGSPGATAD